MQKKTATRDISNLSVGIMLVNVNIIAQVEARHWGDNKIGANWAVGLRPNVKGYESRQGKKSSVAKGARSVKVANEVTWSKFGSDGRTKNIALFEVSNLRDGTTKHSKMFPWGVSCSNVVCGLTNRDTTQHKGKVGNVSWSKISHAELNRISGQNPGDSDYLQHRIKIDYCAKLLSWRYHGKFGFKTKW